jgi:hypothetical protein
MRPEQINQSSIEIHLTRPGSAVYRAGRALAKGVYEMAWNTPSMSDGYALGVVAMLDGVAVGNANLHLGADGRFPSEGYFSPRHWSGYYEADAANLAEVGALAITPELHAEQSEAALLGILYGLCLGATTLSRYIISTVEHRTLVRRLVGYVGLPLRRNTTVTRRSTELPNDAYWHGREAPQIYYLDLRDDRLVSIVGVIHAYLVSKAVPIRLYREDRLQNDDYLSFRRQIAGFARANDASRDPGLLSGSEPVHQRC